jgi:hypothetical protein
MRVGGKQIDAAVARAFIVALAPAGIEAALLAANKLTPTKTLSFLSSSSKSNEHVMRRNAPSGAIVLLTRTTA